MGRRLLLDTGILISWERNRQDRFSPRPDDDLCLSMIAVSEFMTGLALAAPEQQPRLQTFIDRLLEVVPVLPFDEEILDAHVSLRAWVIRHGQPRGQHDLIIAATAITTGRTLVTLDHKARFEELPGVRVIYPDVSSPLAQA
ncbi:MAG: type II toxin-antitoxin system VapC family toxin [Propionibacteriaceae bacterium]|jgi:tRNA(fMet)-specific endonuclease VapC|nr:type II toxin-antitoxin system VapC family toxin [Propionibacteriaceae bacterium]